MSDRETIEDYLRRLKSRLRGLPEAERVRVVLEIQTHLEGRAAAGALREAIDSFGSPAKLAQGFVDDFEAIRAQTPKTSGERTAGMAVGALRYLGACVLGFVSLMLFMFGGGALLIAIFDILYPRQVGVFVYVSPDGTEREVNAGAQLGEAAVPPRGDDVLGGWVVLIGLGLAALLIALGVLIVRYGVLRLLRTRRSKRGEDDVEA